MHDAKTPGIVYEKGKLGISAFIYDAEGRVGIPALLRAVVHALKAGADRVYLVSGCPTNPDSGGLFGVEVSNPSVVWEEGFDPRVTGFLLPIGEDL